MDVLTQLGFAITLVIQILFYIYIAIGIMVAIGNVIYSKNIDGHYEASSKEIEAKSLKIENNIERAKFKIAEYNNLDRIQTGSQFFNSQPLDLKIVHGIILVFGWLAFLLMKGETNE